MPTPTAFLFDIGNVILAFDYHRAAAEIGSRSERHDAEIFDILHDAKTVMEAGGMSAEEFVENSMQSLGFQGSESEFTELFQDIFPHILRNRIRKRGFAI